MLPSRSLIMLSCLFLLGFPLVAASQILTSKDARFRLETVASGLEHPWSLAFLPNGSMLVTERAGRLRVIQSGELLPQPVQGFQHPLYQVRVGCSMSFCIRILKKTGLFSLAMRTVPVKE